MSDERRQQNFYRVRLRMPVSNSEYIVRASGYDEAARKAVEADCSGEGGDDDLHPEGVESITKIDSESVVL